MVSQSEAGRAEAEQSESVKLIAHRIFPDRRALDEFDSSRVRDFDGVELDVRLHANGETYVYHSPIFDSRLRRRRNPTNRFERALELLAELENGPRLLFLDIKCPRSAEQVAGFIRGRNLGFELAFNCWQEPAIDAIRRLLPDAAIFFCIAPIFSKRLAKIMKEDFHVYNRYPFVKAAERFEPDLDRFNGHNINFKIFTEENADLIAPQGADGVCLHRVFFCESLVEFTERRKLKTAVYGIRSRGSRLLKSAGDHIDMAIISGEKRGRRRIADDAKDDAIKADEGKRVA